ncbi:hypothetical protein Tco_1084691, partial [Tanacetum coccineum]
MYTGCPWLYLINNKGTKHKVWLKKVCGTKNYALFSHEWKEFLPGSRYVRVSTLHFIREGEDEYYVGNKMVFTNLLNNNVSLVSFDDSGIALRLENVPRMPLNQDIPFVRGPHDKYKRMEHECDWVNHEEHDNEERCFYAPILAYVTDQKRL